ncbi:serine acetyltransferase [Cephaloticoccus primus]|uniref:Serine acetyltransferase n=1 Tax=Cephaloticoccus primus TaxID=1548207 RepID=A0A139SS25_9BACT|nr:serine O-acetyltransferase EpsC [Cephaloticoccus primus]KXU37347.1 serine acetyltransferase [Cephaloticoccus primus]
MNLDPIQDALLTSYERDGGINHLDGVNLPAQDSVNQLAVDVMHLLFPGYFEEAGLTRAQVPQHVRTLLAQIRDHLVCNVEKCLRFADAGAPSPSQAAEPLVAEALRQLPELRRIVQTDVVAAYHGDPAAHSVEEIILAYPCVLSISVQRFAHILYRLGVPLLPRMLTEFGHERTGTDIHPGARIGTHFFIDHGTGVVIGETARIGNHVKLYQGVTLGAKSFEVDPDGNPVKGIKRHPDIDDHVTIYAHATILGGDTRIGQNSIIGSNVWIMNSVPADSVAYYKGENLIVRSRNAQDKFVETAETLHWVI